MEFRRLSSAQDPLFAEAFELCKASTTVCEQRSLDRQIALTANPCCRFDAIMEGDALAGVILYWELTGYTYIEHFALHPSIRSRGLGRRALTVFCGTRPFVILEINPPVDVITKARDLFYRLSDFVRDDYMHLHPFSRNQFFPRESVVMSYPSRMTEQQYQRFQQDMKEIMMEGGSPLCLKQCREWQ